MTHQIRRDVKDIRDASNSRNASKNRKNKGTPTAALISTAAAAAIENSWAATSGGKLATAAPPANFQKPRPGLKCRLSLQQMRRL
jgi:hypothetical protein